jgi:hypothetical protein
VANPSGNFTTEIPMIYSRYLQVRQITVSLPTTSDFNHRLKVRVTDLVRPIVVSYRLPLLVWALTAAGLICAIIALRPPGGGNKDRPAATSG